MKTKDFFIAYIGKTLNMPAEKVASLFENEEGTDIKDAALDELLQNDATRVKTFTDKNQEFFNNGLAKATKELMTDFEKGLKEKFDFTSNKKGLELIEEIVTTKSGDKTEIEENKVKSHPLYISLQDQMNKKVSDIENQWKEKYDGHVKQTAKKDTLSTVYSTLVPYLEENYGLPEDKEMRANQLQWFNSELEKNDWEQHEKDYIIKDSEGNVLSDKHGVRLTRDKFADQVALKYWPKKEGQPRTGSGGSNNPAGNGKPATGYTGKVPTTEAEYSKALIECKTPQDKIALTDAWNARE